MPVGEVAAHVDSIDVVCPFSAKSELAVLQVLALLRRLDEARAALADGRWRQPVGRSLLGTTTALVGLGAIGTAVARRIAAG